MSTDIWGIDDGYEDALGLWHETPPTTRLALLAAMGVDPAEQSAPPAAPVQGVRSKHGTPVRGPAEVTLEDGTVLQIDAALPPDLPLGYHTLRPLDGGAAVQPRLRTTHLSLSNFWVPIQSLCKGGDYATLVPPCHPAQAATVPHTGLRSLGSGRGHV